MSKLFNVTADCKPNLHYMVHLDERLVKIKEMVDRGDYFTINRARQYGKTTMLRACASFLKKEYIVVQLDFQMISTSKFRNENIFSLTFARIFIKSLEGENILESEGIHEAVSSFRQVLREEKDEFELFELFGQLSEICRNSDKPVVLLIDEVDSAANNQVFLDFLAQLRGYYINRDHVPTFQSVILAGVYDIRNMKRRFRTDEEHKFNSPWNITADFLIDMSFSVIDIEGMLQEYEADYRTGMDIEEIAHLIYDYTSGYPFLVSRICKLIDEQVVGSEDYPDRVCAWTKGGVLAAIRLLLAEQNTLFESLTNKLEDYPELKQLIYSLLFYGKIIYYNPDDTAIGIAILFGFVKENSGIVVVANRLFETRLYNMFLASSEVQNSEMYKNALLHQSQFDRNGHLDMKLILEKFVMHFSDIYGDCRQIFLEEDGRRYFLLYLRPIINGVGNYYIEARTRNMERTDVIVDYHGEQFIIELKVWRGNAYNERGEKQLTEYLDYYHLKKGYMLSFNFNQKKQVGVREIILGNKILVEATV